MNVSEYLIRSANYTQTVRAGRRPGTTMEYTNMMGIHPMSFDLAKLASQEQEQRLRRAVVIAEANRGNERQLSVIRSIRANFGGAVISLGQRIRGERAESIDAPVPSAQSLRIAR